MANVCLTQRQQQYFDYFKKYQKDNGVFPTPAQACRDLRSQGIRCAATNIQHMVGTLFLKGAFTGGTPLTAGNKRLHGMNNKAIDVKTLDIKPKAKAQPVAAQPANLDAIIQREIVKYFRNMAAGAAPLTLNE